MYANVRHDSRVHLIHALAFLDPLLARPALVWLDEEPPSDVYFEALTRTNVTQGPVTLMFTPLLGVSTVVKRFSA